MLDKLSMHSHTYHSDGQFSPTELAQKAYNEGLKALVVTDHDEYRGLGEFVQVAGGLGLDTMTGIEITTFYKGVEVHILGYGFELSEKNKTILDNALQNTWKMRNERIEINLAKLAQNGVVNTNIETVKRVVNCHGPYLHKSHIINYLVSTQYFDYEQTKAYFKRGGLAYVGYDNSLLMSPVEVVELINKIGGKAVIAHPGEFARRTDLKSVDWKAIFIELVDMLMKVGLVGVEAYHCNHTADQVEFLLRETKKRSLFITAGSDFHGAITPERSLVIPCISYEEYLKFKEFCLK